MKLHAFAIAPLLAVALLAPALASAQTDATGTLTSFPFEVPFDVVASSESPLSRVVDAPFQACVDHFQDALVSRDSLADGWAIGGQGFDVAAQSWRFGLLREGRTLYGLVVTRHPSGCEITLETEATTMPGGRYRWGFPALRLSDGTTLAVDPLVIED